MSHSLELRTQLEYGKVPYGDKREVHLLVTLEGRKLDSSKRKPLTIAVRLDCSGSMGEEHGRKLDYAKRSLLKLIDHLTDQDRLSVSGFSDDVFSVVPMALMTSEAKVKAKAEIEKLRPLASTNLSGATLDAYSDLKDVSGDVIRAFLFTDGLPTAGVTDRSSLVSIAGQKPGSSGLTAFGYGADHDPELLASMAKAGGGNFYFVKTPDQCPGFFGRELGGLLTLVAQGVKVKVKTHAEHKILEVLNDLDVKSNDQETEAVISVDDVYSEEKRKIVLKLQLPETTKAVGVRPCKVCDVEISYQDVLANEPRTAEAAVKVEYVEKDEADKKPNKEVEEQMALLKAAEAQDEAIKLADQGDLTGARKLIKEAAFMCHEVGTQFADAVGKDLEANVMECFASETAYRAGGQGYTQSNRASYLRGRGATRGASHLFATSAMKGMAADFEKGEAECDLDPMPVQEPEAPVAKPSKAVEKKSKGLSKTRKTRR